MQKAASVRTSVRLALLLSATATAAAPAFGSEPAADSLETVVIVGVTPLPGSEVDVNTLAVPAESATAEDIRRSHALDISAFLSRQLGGVYINDVQNNPLQPDINYRGYTASPLLGTPQGLSLYMDGVRLNQPFGDVVSWDLIPRQAISTLTLMPGSNPLFGLNTLGGALSLRTKDGFTDPGASIELNYGSNDRRAITGEVGGHSANGLYWYATANDFREEGWRDDSPSDATQVFGKLGWRSDTTDVFASASHADTDLTGNGLQEQQFLVRDYASVYTRPDNTQNQSWLVNLVGSQKVSDVLTLSANAFYRDIRTATLNGDINDDSLGESVYQPSVTERNALAAAGYTGFPAAGETQVNTPFPRWRCIANILLNSEPNEKCNGLDNRSHTGQHDGGLSAQAAFNSQLGSRANTLTLGVTQVRSRARFTQTSQFGYLTPDRGVATVAGSGAFADGTQGTQKPAAFSSWTRCI
jgi:outer membrane receptor for Fe3+-dicitrate